MNRIVIGGLPPKFEMEGDFQGKEMFKICCAFICATGGYYLFKEGVKYYFWKKKLDHKPKRFSHPEPVNNPITRPRPETLNEICEKSNADIADLQLCGNLLCKGDTLVISSSDGEGKSTLAMGMCVDIARGSNTHLLPDDKTPYNQKPQSVYYFDAELSDDDIQLRYGKHDFHFPENLKRFSSTYESETEMFDHIEELVGNEKSDVTICIDNLSAIIPTASPKAYHDLFSRQKKIKDVAKANGYYVTFIIIAHTTKTKQGHVNETFYGSSHLGNLSASRIALLPTRFGDEYKMLKVQKNRKMPKEGNVIIVKRVSTPYLHFEYFREMKEDEATPLKQKTVSISSVTPASEILVQKPKAPNQKVTPEKEEKIIAMYNKGMKQSTIANKLRLSTKTVHRTLTRLKQEGHISA